MDNDSYSGTLRPDRVQVSSSADTGNHEKSWHICAVMPTPATPAPTSSPTVPFLVTSGNCYSDAYFVRGIVWKSLMHQQPFRRTEHILRGWGSRECFQLTLHKRLRQERLRQQWISKLPVERSCSSRHEPFRWWRFVLVSRLATGWKAAHPQDSVLPLH